MSWAVLTTSSSPAADADGAWPAPAHEARSRPAAARRNAAAITLRTTLSREGSLAEFLLEVRHKNPPTKVRVSPPHESRRASVYRTARTTPLSRLTLLEKAARLGVAEAARQMGVSRQTVYRWRRRVRELEDRSCRPRRSPRRTAPAREAALLQARLEWRWGPDRLGPMTGLSRRTAYRILRRFHMHRLRELFPRGAAAARSLRGPRAR